MELAGQRVVVIGGTSGIGLATARAAASDGASVVIAGRDPGRLEKALSELPDAVTGSNVDATSRDALDSFFSDVGDFDHLVLAASSGAGGGPFVNLDVDRLRAAFEGKFFAYFQAAQACLGTLREGGSIVMITAGSARTTFPATSGLAAINGALEAMIPTLALELKPTRVNGVSPGVIDTPWWDNMPADSRDAAFAQIAASSPVRRVGQPDDVAQAVVFLMQDTYMTGTILECDGGARIK
jgi:NAD(P)-dependent dehydrogenase (short-subunit alcohol dehydrogenase family)